MEKREAIAKAAEKNSLNRPSITPETNKGQRITKSSGYIPIQRQVEMLLEAGTGLLAARRGEYDFQDANHTSFDVNDPTRRQNFDLADASELQRNTDKEIKKIKRRQYLERQKLMQSLQKSEVSTGDTINKENVSQGGTK